LGPCYTCHGKGEIRREYAAGNTLAEEFYDAHIDAQVLTPMMVRDWLQGYAREKWSNREEVKGGT
jgi:hypothetical protein